MICPDINILLYAHFRSFPQHTNAMRWWDGVLSGTSPVRIGHVVILGFLRISTNRKVFALPLTMSQAIQVVDGWLSQPNVKLIAPSDTHWINLKTMLTSSHAGSNLTTDAHIAALAGDYGMTVYTNDTDFGRFSGIKFHNPL